MPSLSNQLSVLSQAVSVLSQQASVQSNQISALSQAVSILSQAHSVLSQAVSVADAALSLRITSVAGAGGGSAIQRVAVVNTGQSVSSGTLITVSGLSLAMSAGGLYQLEGLLLVNLAVGAAIRRFGLSFPKMVRARGDILAPTSALQGGIPTGLSVVPQIIPFTGDSASGSIIVSAISIGRVSNVVAYRGVFKVSTGGTMHILAGGSAPNGVVTVLDGSYIKLLRLN